MYKVIKRDCPMFGIGPYLCEYVCDTTSDISTLPTFSSEGTGGRTAYDNQKCASGSRAIVAENGSESKQYMLNNQDIWCPYSVSAGSSSGGSSESSITVDFALSETSENPVANKTITAALNNKADMTHTHTANEVGADASGSAASVLVEAKSYTDSEIEILNEALNNKANASDLPDLSVYALKSKYGDTTIDVGRKADTTVGNYSTAEGHSTTASGDCSHAEGVATTASGDYSHAEGESTTASAESSHAEGYSTTANVMYSHAEGYRTTANGPASHAEGYRATANGAASHAEGENTTAIGNNSHAGGTGTKALFTNEVAYGSYNKSNSDTLFSIGDGTDDDARHNAFEITKTGGILHDKNIATTDDIPVLTPYAKKTDVPGIKVNEAVNADTVGGKSADDFAQLKYLGENQIDTKTAVGVATKTVIYHCLNWTDYPAEAPDGQGTIIAINYNGAGTAGVNQMWCTQIFISAHGGVFLRNVANLDISSWKDYRDGGNANTVGGKDPGKIFYDNGMSSDLNNATKSGCYCASPDTLNTPLSVWLLVDTMNYNNQLIVQKAYTMGDTARTITYIRNYANNVWSSWSEISTMPINSTNTENPTE